MQDGQAVHVARVRLSALVQQARAGGEVTAYQVARALEPMLELVLEVARDSGRWQEARAAAIAADAQAEAEARLAYGPGAWEPGAEIPVSPVPPPALPRRGAPRPGRGARAGRPAGRPAACATSSGSGSHREQTVDSRSA
jgi:hypothetical protein